MAKAEVIAYHGWGFDGDCWKTWSSVLPYNVRLSTYNRGYFSEPREPAFNKDTQTRILITHSFGLHLCSDELISKADLLVIFGGFISFHPQAPKYRRRSRLIVNQMIKRFHNHPDQVLDDFYQNVFSPQQSWESPRESMNRKLLLGDLMKLNDHKTDILRLNYIPKICILHGFRDTIVPCNKGRELYEELQSDAKYLEVKDAGHALPFTHTEQCWAFIKPEVEELTARI